MRRAEALQALHTGWLVLDDMGEKMASGDYEETHARLDGPCRLSVEDCRTYADHLLPSGYRGRVKLVLYPPAYVRALALLVGILRSVEDD